MMTVRRWYLFVSATIGLQGFVWALIWLLYGAVAADQPSVLQTAFRLSALLICLPLWLVHWLWGERLARRDPDERASAVRKLYLYGNLAAFLIPLTSSVRDFGEAVLLLLTNTKANDSLGQLWYGLITSIVLGVMFAYHSVVARNDAHQASLTGAGALVRRIYLLVAAGIGLLIWTGGATDLIRLILRPMMSTVGMNIFINSTLNLLIGMTVWVGHWWRAQRLFDSAEEDERASAFRKFYLYLVIVVAAMIAVTTAVVVLAGIFRTLLGLTVEGDLVDAIASTLVALVVAFYHANVLRSDAAAIAEGPRQAAVRRLAWYLIAAIGQVALIVGLGGLLSVIIRAVFGTDVITDLRDSLAWFGAILVVGFPVWLVAWRYVQRASVTADSTGVAERSSLIRRIYLFGFLFVALVTLVVAFSYVMFRLISVALGASFAGNLLVDLAQAIVFSLIATGVLVTHGLALRADTRVREAAERSRQAQVRVAIWAPNDMAVAIAETLRQQLPQLGLTIVGQTGESETQLASADFIVGVWTPESDPRWFHRYPAHKLLLPLNGTNWSWVGIDPEVMKTIPSQLAQAVRQTLAGESLRPRRSVSAGLIVGTVVAIGFIILILFGVIQIALLAFA